MDRPTPTRFADAPALAGRARIAIITLIMLAHVLLGIALVRAFSGIQTLAGAVGLGQVLTATVVAAPPSPAATATSHEPDQGASGAAAKRAKADQIVAPPARLPVPAPPAAPVAGTGSDTRSGASAGGEGTGGASNGTGTGSGGAGHGSGGGMIKPVKIAGELAEADYAKAGRAKRLGTSVIVVLTVGIDGRVRACRVHQPSGDPDADVVTCKLAIERFRFKPALDANGEPVEATFGWQQSFFWK